MPSILSRGLSVGCAVLLATSAPTVVHAQVSASKGASTKAAVPNHATTLELVGLSGKSRTLRAADIAAMPHVDATVSSHNVQGTYSGVSLGSLLRLVDRPAGEALRGAALATAVSVEASDGYRIIFALAEVDSGFTNKVILLADKKNGAAIDAMEGPFRLIVPDEARPGRWAKQVTRIRLIPVK